MVEVIDNTDRIKIKKGRLQDLETIASEVFPEADVCRGPIEERFFIQETRKRYLCLVVPKSKSVTIYEAKCYKQAYKLAERFEKETGQIWKLKLEYGN